VDLRHDPWQPTPNRPPDAWPPHLPADPGLPGWLEERLFDQRIVMVRGPLTQPAATGIAVIDSMAAPVHALVTAEAGGAALAVLAAAAQRAAYRHARFKLTEPRATSITGTADEVAAAAGQHLRELEEMVLRLVEVTGQPRSRVEDDLSAVRSLSAAEARDYGLIQSVVGDDERGPGQPDPRT
jgi:ATP-dependent Clp protease protease subunit